MTDMIAQDLQDMHEHKFATALAALMTLLTVALCTVGCGALVLVLGASL